MAFPGTYNFNYYRGDTSQFVIRPKTANGSAFDLAGYTAAFTVATGRGSSGTQTAATAVVNATTDIVTCTISVQYMTGVTTSAVGIIVIKATFTVD